MLERARREGAVAQHADDDVIERAVLDAVPDAHRIASWILRDSFAAEDAVHDAVVLAWSKRRSLTSADTVSGWFIRIVVNVCRDDLRRKRRSPSVGAIELEAEIPGHRDDAGPDRLSEYADLAAALDTLDADDRVILALRFGRDLTIPDIASVVGIREGTAKSRLHHALEHLRAALAAEQRADALAREAQR